MKFVRSTAALAVFLCLTATTVTAGPLVNVSIYGGLKYSDDDRFIPDAAGDEQDEYGGLLIFGKDGWDTQLLANVLISESKDSVLDEDGDRVLNEYTELGAGFAKVWTLSSRIDPYVGGGLGLFWFDGAGGSDNAVGGWVEGGFFYRPPKGAGFNVGVTLRLSHASEIEVAGDVQSGGVHGLLTVGWGKRP